MHKCRCVYAVAGLFHAAVYVADFDTAADLNNSACAVVVFAVDVAVAVAIAFGKLAMAIYYNPKRIKRLR